MICIDEIWAMREEGEGVLLLAEKALVRLMCGVKWKNRNNELITMLELSDGIVTLVDFQMEF